MWVVRLLYKLLGIYLRIHIMDSNSQLIKANIKIKIIPMVGDSIYFEADGEYFLVTKIIHNINFKHEIWIVVQAITK